MKILTKKKSEQLTHQVDREDLRLILDFFAYGSGSTPITKQHRDGNEDRGKIIRLFDSLRIGWIAKGILKIIMGIIWRLFISIAILSMHLVLCSTIYE